MSRLSPAGFDPNLPPPPLQPGLPMPQPDRGAGMALAGFVCGLVSLIAALPGALLGKDAVPGFSSGEGVLLIIGTLPVALVGLLLSFLGRRSTSRRWLAIAGMVCSVLAVVPFVVLSVALAQLYSYCHAHSCY